MAVLVPCEVDQRFESLGEVNRDGVTIMFISRKLEEVLKVADAVTVIRAGTTVTTVDPKDVTARDLAELMVGSELPTPETRESTVNDRVVLAADGLRVTSPAGRTILADVSSRIRSGEILGIARVGGNGQPARMGEGRGA